MIDESARLKAARKLDHQALTEIFDLYAPALYKYALRLCQDPVQADHVVGDVFARLLEQLADGGGPRINLRSYLYQIAYHILVDRSNVSYQTIPLEEAAEIGDGNPPLEEAMEDDRLLETVMSAINLELTPDQRQVLLLRFVEGFTPQETSAILKKSLDNTKVIQTRALTKLRQVLVLGKLLDQEKQGRPAL